MAKQQKRLAQPPVPIYYFTSLEGILNEDPEDNPLSYAGLVPGRSGIGLYDAREMRNAGFKFSRKDENQIRVRIPGKDLSGFLKAQLFLNIKPQAAQAK